MEKFPTHAVAFSNGTIIDNPRFVKQSQEKVNRLAKKSKKVLDLLLNGSNAKRLVFIPSAIANITLKQGKIGVC